MATTTTDRTEKAKTQTPQPQDFLASMWDNALKTQRQMFGAFSQPFGFTPAPEKMWNQWQVLNKECLEQTEKNVDRMKDFVNDEVKFARDFSDKALEMTKDVEKDTLPTVKPEFARAWFDTSWRCIERGVDFNTKSMKAAEEFGLKVSEMIMKDTTPKA